MSNSGSLQFCQPWSTGTITSKRLTSYLYLVENGVCVCVCVYECVGVRWAFSELLNGHSVCSKQATERGRERRKIEGNTAVCHFISVRFR